MKNESKFWQDVADVSNPGWNIRVDPLVATAAGGLTGNDVFVYVVDVEHCWIAAGATSSQAAVKVVEALQLLVAAQKDDLAVASLTAADIAGQAILRCGAERSDAGSPAVAAAVSVTVAALRETKTFELAARTNRGAGLPDMSGHWFYLAYRLTNGSSIARPVWIPTMQLPAGVRNRFLEPQMLMESVRAVVQGDTTSSDTLVGRTLAAAGGVSVSPKLRAVAKTR